jgi:VanZ family protein
MNFVRTMIGWALGTYWVLLFTATHIPGQDMPDTHVNDKLEHFLAYGMLGGLIFLNLWTRRPARRNIGGLVLAIGAAYGAVDEWTQAIPYIHRSCELRDWFADVAGLSIAAGGMTLVKWVVSRAAKPARDGPARLAGEGAD